MRKATLGLAAVLVLAGLGGYFFLRPGPGNKGAASTRTTRPTYLEPRSDWKAHGPYYDIFRFNAAWSDLPEGSPETLTVSKVIDQYQSGEVFFQLVNNQATFTKQKYGYAINSAGTEGSCDLSPEPCFRVRIQARFTLHHLYEKNAYGTRVLMGVPRWCGVQSSRSGGGEFLSNGLRGHTECPNILEPNFFTWEWMNWKYGANNVPVWTADGVTYGRGLSGMKNQVAIEIRAAVDLPCWSFGERDWNLAYEYPAPPGAEFPDKGYTKHDLLPEVEKWAKVMKDLSGASGDAAKALVESDYPDLAKKITNVNAGIDIVSRLRDLVDATSPETTDAKKKELLDKYSWDLIKTLLKALKAPSIAIKAFETGYALGTPVGQAIAKTCEALDINSFRTWALIGYHQNKEAADAGKEFEYQGRVFRRRNGIFEIRIAGEPVGAMAAFPVIGIFADRQPVWLPLPE